MNTNQSEVARFDQRLNAMRSNGLSDIKIVAGRVSETSPEAFAREANALLDAIERDEFEAYSFNDMPALKAQ